MPQVTMTVNGTLHAVEARSDEVLLDVLRDKVACTSVREGCGVGLCGACTAIVNGLPASTCLLLAASCDGADILTTEGLAHNDPVVAAFSEVGAMQCGYCTPGFVLMVHDLLAENASPTQEQIDEHLAGNLCRCAAYLEIREAVRRATPAEIGGPDDG